MKAPSSLVLLCAAPLLLAAPIRPGGETKLIKCEGHTTFVVSVAVSPDGKLVVSGSDDETMRFWNPADGKAIRAVMVEDKRPDGGWVGAVTFSPDGRALTANVTPRGVTFFDPATGKIDRGRPTFREGAYGVAFSPDGKLLATASDRSVRVYDAVKGNKVREFTFDKGIGRSWRVAFSPDGNHLAAALHDYGGEERTSTKVRVWDLRSGEQVFAAWEHGGHANAVAFSPDGKYLAAGGEHEGSVEVYDWAANKQVARFRADAHVVFCLTFSADGKKLYTGGNDPDVKVWDAVSGKSAGKLEGHTDQVADLARSKDGKVLATAGRDKRVLIWHLDGKR